MDNTNTPKFLDIHTARCIYTKNITKVELMKDAVNDIYYFIDYSSGTPINRPISEQEYYSIRETRFTFTTKYKTLRNLKGGIMKVWELEEGKKYRMTVGWRGQQIDPDSNNYYFTVELHNGETVLFRNHKCGNKALVSPLKLDEINKAEFAYYPDKIRIETVVKIYDDGTYSVCIPNAPKNSKDLNDLRNLVGFTVFTNYFEL